MRAVKYLLEKDTDVFRVTNIYAPNSPVSSYFGALSSWLASLVHHKHYMGGDFNTCVNILEDKTPLPHLDQKRDTPTSDTPNTPLAIFMSSMQLIDLWCQYHPTDKEFTYYSPPHKILSRMDYIFGSTGTFHLTEDSSINEIVISDHALISIDIRDTTTRPNHRSWRFLANLVNQTTLLDFLQREWTLYADLNYAHKSNQSLFWEGGKAYIRGRIIAYILS